MIWSLLLLWLWRVRIRILCRLLPAACCLLRCCLSQTSNVRSQCLLRHINLINNNKIRSLIFLLLWIFCISNPGMIRVVRSTEYIPYHVSYPKVISTCPSSCAFLVYGSRVETESHAACSPPLTLVQIYGEWISSRICALRRVSPSRSRGIIGEKWESLFSSMIQAEAVEARTVTGKSLVASQSFCFFIFLRDAEYLDTILCIMYDNTYFP